MVVLVPAASFRQNALRYRTAQTDENGKFPMKGVAPGEYTICLGKRAIHGVDEASFLAKYQDRGSPVVVSQGTRVEEQLDLIPADSSRP